MRAYITTYPFLLEEPPGKFLKNVNGNSIGFRLSLDRKTKGLKAKIKVKSEEKPHVELSGLELSDPACSGLGNAGNCCVEISYFSDSGKLCAEAELEPGSETDFIAKVNLMEKLHFRKT